MCDCFIGIISGDIGYELVTRGQNIPVEFLNETFNYCVGVK